MTTVKESWWVLSVALAAKCGVGGSSLANFSFFLLSWALLSLLCWAVPGGPAWGWYWWRRCPHPRAVIQGPRGLPFLGSIGLMTGLTHRHLAAAADALAARRLMAFSLGQTRAVVTCDPEVAKEILSGPAFMDRPVKESAYGLLFHRALGFAPHGVYWRTLRRIAATHFFCPKQIADAEPQRARISAQMVAALISGRSKGEVVRARDVLKEGALYNLVWNVFGKRYDIGESSTNQEMVELLSLVEEGYDLLGIVNWSDYLPFLASFDLQAIKSRCSALVPCVYAFAKKIIEERRASNGATGTFVDVMLSLQKEEKLSDDDIIAVLWEMIVRGTDTVAVLIEWTMARVVMHPEVQAKAHEELDLVVGRGRAVAEADVVALPYVQAVVKEALRVHPPGPLLSWSRLSTRDAVVDGRVVPAGTTAMVNMWAIGRDPHVWEDPKAFRPERFLAGGEGADVSVFGSDLRLAPFGSGRRGCPGKALGMATVDFWVASLLHEFEWREPSDGTRGVDLSEVMRLSCEMAVPLAAALHPRRRLGAG